MQKLRTLIKKVLLALVVLTLSFGNTALPLSAQSTTVAPTKPVSVTATSDGVILEWGSAVNDNGVTAASALQTLPTMHFQGYDLPMRLITLQLPAAKAASLPAALLQIEQTNSVAWKGNLVPSGPLQPPALDWKNNSDLKPLEKVALPTSPIFVLRQGKIHGQPVAVVAISPLYQKNGVIQLATSLNAKAAGATQLDDNVANLLKALPAADNAVSAAGVTTTDLAPTNSAAATNSVKISVNQPGLQVLSSQSLASAGLNPGALDLTKLHLYHNGQEIPLEIGQTPALEVRFYAATAGDRWNLSETYWLTVEATNGLRMATRDVTPGGATATQTANAKGYWAQNLVYNSLQAGADGDHWFNTTMEVAPAQLNNPASYPTATVTLNNSVLPLVAGTSLYTFTVSTYFRANYKLHVDFGGTAQDLTWNSAPPPQGVLVENWALPLSTTAMPSQIRLTLLPGNEVQGLNLDRVYWQRPVSLNFQNQGAAFTGLSGAWLYNWQNAPVNNGQYQLYDVSNPDAPVSLTGANGAGFQDGMIAHDYLLAGPGAIQTPQAIAHSAFVFSAAAGADALYIVPSQAYIPALKPLLDQRSAQGYSATTVNVQDIYDAWSYGRVSAEAIRNFLRFAKANWHPSPISVVLIGDATWDPHGYLNLGVNNVNLMPAYMADVDPYIGETACENCFVQLDGDNPVTGDDPANSTQPGKFLKADMWIGRFPVKTVDELTNVVNKIIHYENQASTGFWRGTAVFLADNYIKSLDANQKPVVDSAGDFAAISDQSVNLAPKQALIKRVYYDPYPQISDPQQLQSWRVSNADTVWTDVMSDLNAGAGLVTYNGHSHHWQWGSTDLNSAKPYLFSLYDTDLLSNYDSLFIELSMTCYTSQFTKAASSGTTFDERMFLNPRGGAVAIWGPAGLSVAHGHDALQRGFYTKLWASEPMKARLGDLLEAGYTELLTKSTCCQDAIQTFLLLGDPLTPARVNAAAAPSASIFLPVVSRK